MVSHKPSGCSAAVARFGRTISLQTSETRRTAFASTVWLMKNKQDMAKRYNIEGAGGCSIHRFDRRNSARKCASTDHFVPLNGHLSIQFLFLIFYSVLNSLWNGSIRRVQRITTWVICV
ncbi:hypothetical protein FGIG_05893 [Fasciola gigantica]|uniref:Uncharacterized protein n=1 Tax=Fasciola gigantica TaxID=46835 RepID=A0A504YRH2_FASGI|nr:hypothetical protein FGIG_05893 [Fasciola gigantica]